MFGGIIKNHLAPEASDFLGQHATNLGKNYTKLILMS